MEVELYHYTSSEGLSAIQQSGYIRQTNADPDAGVLYTTGVYLTKKDPKNYSKTHLIVNNYRSYKSNKSHKVECYVTVWLPRDHRLKKESLNGGRDVWVWMGGNLQLDRIRHSFGNVYKYKSSGKVIDDFIQKWCPLLEQEARAEKDNVENQCGQVKAKAVKIVHDEDVGTGWIVEFSCSSQDKPKKGVWLESNTKKRGIVSSINSGGFSLSVESMNWFPVYEAFTFSLMIHNTKTLENAILNIEDESIYKPGEPSGRIRDILLGLAEPSKSTKPNKVTFLNSNLDTSQKEAVMNSLRQKDLSIIHGPPGTGKTTTLVEIIQQTRRTGERILVCSASHAAVDNLMARMIETFGGAGLVRVGEPVKIQKSHLKYSLAANSGTQEEKILAEAWIVFGTLTGCAGNSAMEKLPQQHFGLTVVDECGQAVEAAVWAVVRFTSKLLLAGDHQQLPPTVLCDKPSVKKALSISMMERLVKLYKHTHPVVSLLDTQYRMTSKIMTWPSSKFYKSKLKAAPSVASRTLAQLSGVRNSKVTKEEIVLVDTKGTMAQIKSSHHKKSSKANPGEAGIVLSLVGELVKMGVKTKDIGVITFYALQADLIRHNLGSNFDEVEVNTVDGFQGREKEVVIVSTVRSNTEGNIGFLKEYRRLNVAVTRARRKLVIVADTKTFSRDRVWKGFFGYIKTQSVNNPHGFHLTRPGKFDGNLHKSSQGTRRLWSSQQQHVAGRRQHANFHLRKNET